ncbi:MAG: TetR/AcrR family transcriptional regulator, partial [Moraxellaceae bacterium]|nr:TetR/AcrR family transcriptional regulator [Moraxellaceae bacterium]
MSELIPRRYRGASAQERQQERHERLLDAGLHVFGQSGYHGATVRGICQQAGLTERYFYESFANSEELLCAVYALVLASQRERMTAAITQAAPQHDAMIRAGLSAFFAYIRECPAAARVQFVEVLGVSPRVDQLYRHAIEDFARLMRTLDIQPSSAMTGIDGDMLSIGLIGAMVGIGSRWMLSGFTQSLDEMVATSEILFAGVSQQ